MKISLIVLIFIQLCFGLTNSVYLPVNAPDRKNISTIELSSIGQFGIMRKARPNVPAHYHTGIDIKRPGVNYENEPVFPMANGRVISVRDDGPYAQIIIEHSFDEGLIWTVYEHIAGIRVNPGQEVSPFEPIARFMNKAELYKFGWQFNHVHFEVMKIPPLRTPPTELLPKRYFSTYALTCYTIEELHKRYYHPMEFYKLNLNN